MNEENDLTLHGWFAGEESRMMVHRDHEQYRWSRDVEHSRVRTDILFGDDKGQFAIALSEWVPPIHFAVLGPSDGKIIEDWDNHCIKAYYKAFGDARDFIKGFGKHYEYEYSWDCHRCGVSLTPLNHTVSGELCDSCDESFTDPHYRL